MNKKRSLIIIHNIPMCVNRLLIVACILFTSCSHQVPQKVLLVGIDGGRVLNGKVKEVFDEEAGLFEINYFDEQGNLTNKKRWMIDLNDSAKRAETDTQKTEYSSLYDNNKNKIAITEHWSFFPVRGSKWEFDKSGKIVNFIMDITDTLKSSGIHYKYNTLGDMIEEHIHGDLNSDSAVFKYDSNHWPMEEDIYHKNVLVTKVNMTNRKSDSHKNWIKFILRVRNYSPLAQSDTTFPVTRKITYY